LKFQKQEVFYISVSNANVQSAAGNIETAKIRLGRATSDFNRYENLYKKSYYHKTAIHEL
jgi:multidrug resistance efflux pump